MRQIRLGEITLLDVLYESFCHTTDVFICQLYRYAFTGDYQDYHLHLLDLSHYKNVYGK